MTGIKHAFVSGKTDSADTTLVRPSDWNDDHIIDGDVEFNGHNISTSGNNLTITTNDGGTALPRFSVAANGAADAYLDLSTLGLGLRMVNSALANQNFITMENYHGASGDIADISVNFKDSAANNYVGNLIRITQDDATNGSEDTSYSFFVNIAGLLTNALTLGPSATFGTPLTVGTSNAITCGSIEIGAAADTTIARSSAGHISVEGSIVGLASDTLSFFTASTSNAIGVGTIELGAASDTTIARSSAGHISVEGSVVGLASDTLSFFTTSTSNTIGVGNIELGAASDTTLSRAAAGRVTVEGVELLRPAAQSDQETSTSNILGVTPGTQQYHPSAAKVWCQFNASGTIAASYNVTSVADNGTGSWTPTIATDFSSANYAIAACGGIGAAAYLIYNIAAHGAGTLQINSASGSNVATDPSSVAEIYFVAFGDQ